MEPVLRIRQELRQAARQVAAVKDPDMALLFCYIAASGGSCALPAPQQLGMDESRLQKARSLLVLYGVCSDSQGPQRPRKEVHYDPAELKEARQADGEFAGLCDYYEGMAGHIMKKSEMEILYAVYDTLGLPAEVLMLLINYCAGIQRLSPRFLEQQAYKWSKEGVETYAQAEQYLANLQQRHSRQGEIMRLFGIYDRKLSESEQRLVDKWISYGYDSELIALAYDRTVLRTGALKWNYLDSILESWRVAGYKNRQDVEQNEGQQAPRPAEGSGPAPQAPRGEFGSGVVAAVTKQFERKRLQREQLQKTRLEDLRRRDPAFCGKRKSPAPVRQPGRPGGCGRGSGRSGTPAPGEPAAAGPEAGHPGKAGLGRGLFEPAAPVPRLQRPGVYRHGDVPLLPAGMPRGTAPPAGLAEFHPAVRCERALHISAEGIPVARDSPAAGPKSRTSPKSLERAQLQEGNASDDPVVKERRLVGERSRSWIRWEEDGACI